PTSPSSALPSPSAASPSGSVPHGSTDTWPESTSCTGCCGTPCGSGPRAATSELATLDFATALGEDRYQLTALGQTLRGLFREVLHAPPAPSNPTAHHPPSRKEHPA